MKKQQKKKLLAAATTDAATTPEVGSQDANQDSRRTFLRNGLLAAAGFYIVPRNVLDVALQRLVINYKLLVLVLAVKVKAIYTTSLCLGKQIS